MVNGRTIFILFWLGLILCAGCRQEPGTAVSPTPTSASSAKPEPTAVTAVIEPAAQNDSGLEENIAAPVVISELLAGVPGANNHEFIELYNPAMDTIDLNGWSLWYLTRDGQEESLVYSWSERADIPGQGHYLLVHAGEDFDLLPDAVYDAALFEGKGGLSLLDADGQVVDRLGWGEAPRDYFAGSPVVEFTKGESLERRPGGIKGSGENSGDNAADFSTRPDPDPQNSGSPLTPLNPDRLEISLDYPQAVAPGAEFDLVVEVTNYGGTPATQVLVSVPIAGHFTLGEIPAGAVLDEGRLSWPIESIAAGETAASTLRLTAPYANIHTLMSGYYAELAGHPRAYGPLQILPMDGSAIPIAVARALPKGSIVTIEGVATMYPGAFFAGSSSAKFYLEDETGGVQIFADGGRFDVSVNLGDRVRVTGRTELFRDSLEVIPLDNVIDVEVLDRSGPVLEPTPITIVANETEDEVLGRLNVLEGLATRIEEFAYHYEVDLDDEAGNRTLLYIEKDTGINTESLALDHRYRVTGISELASGVRQLKPRLPSDIVEIFPPVLLLEAAGPTNVLPGQTMTVTLTAVNHTDAPMTDIQINAVRPDGSTEAWLIPALDGHGAAESVSYLQQVPLGAAGIADIGTHTAVADQWTEPAIAAPFETYIGEGVPIWAIQGSGSRSPLIGEKVTAVGAVTGKFPEMDGFFLQTLDPDGDQATSDGIFVSTENFGPKVNNGDFVEIHGRVREDAGQTILQLTSPADISLRSETAAEAFIEPVVFDPPADPLAAEAYKESLEGMLVTINEPAVVTGPTNQYGEYALVYPKWGVDMIRRTDGSLGFVMWVDDGTFNRHEDQTTLPVAVARGDLVDQITGPLAYTFGNFKIAPLTVPEVSSAERPLPEIPEATGGQFAVATFNVENMFDTNIPHPADLPRLTAEEYQQELHRVAEAIVAMGAPAILGLQEVENLGILEDLAAQPQLAAYDYEALLLEGKDSRGIDQGYLIRGDQVTVGDYALYDAPNELFSRPPLVLTATVHLDSGDQPLILLNNHFLSLSAGEVQTEPVRNNQAAWNITLIEELRAKHPDTLFIVLGDLNSFYRSKPLQTLQAGGLRHAYEFFTAESELPYTYIFEGATQTLDHILMSPALFEKLTLVEALHINADFPLADPGDLSFWRVSDHDPLVAIFTMD